jgi:predicted nucleic acid-binding protein
MRIGVDSSVIIAAVHVNHPLHLASSHWLNKVMEDHDVLIAHHSVLKSYAVLTRLPAQYRLLPAEAQAVLTGTLRENTILASFAEADIWSMIDTMVQTPASGGASYDKFIIEILAAAEVDGIATHNARDFRRLSTIVRIIDPLA